MKMGTRVGWMFSDGGQDNGEYVVVESRNGKLLIENEHGRRFHAEAKHCWLLEDES